MPPAYSIHPASEVERLAAYRNAHEMWNRGLSLEAFLEQRLRSVRHNRAQWWVLTLEGEVVSALARYPLQFQYGGEVVAGFGVGSVHTRPKNRRQGWAALLCREVARASAAQGDRLALLFSDIAPAYYERLGYHTCPSATHRCERLAELAGSGAQGSLEPISPAENRERLADWYRQAHTPDRLSLWRESEYWLYSLRKDPADRFFLIRPPGGEPEGYLRLAARPDELEVVELALGQPDAGLEEAAYRAAAALALEQGQRRLTGWLRPSAVVSRWFAETPRDKAIPMLCPLTARVDLDQELLDHGCHFWHSDHF